MDGNALDSLRKTLASAAYTSGTTHNFYHYPARFSPMVARDVISTFSKKDDWVLDPFMGGGTSIVEGLALGRRMIGVDVNALAHFIASVRTRPLSEDDEAFIRAWANVVARELSLPDVDWISEDHDIENLPRPVAVFVAGALEYARLMLPRRQAFARCALLRLGQWALDCRDFAAPRRKRLAAQLPILVDEMLDGLHGLVAACRDAGLSKRDLVRRRTLVHRDASGCDGDPRLVALGATPKLVFTSPPYPGVHVLYHRWQYRGRKETAAPYWIARVPDGYGASFYCGGSRTPTGLRNYFRMITDAFKSVRSLVADDAWVVQLVGFSNVADQLPRYLESMAAAGFRETLLTEDGVERMARRVPNRKWYAKLQGNVDAATELLLVHRPTA